MSASDFPVTTAVRMLRQFKVDFEPRPYAYEDHGGTSVASGCLGVDEHAVIKTLIFESGPREQFVVLMHGDCEVSAKELARVLGVKRVEPASQATAERLTGYKVGGISPFGTRTKFKVYVEAGILKLERIYINGGKRGFLVEMAPQELVRVLGAVPVEVAV